LRLGVAPEAVRAEFKKFRRSQREAPASPESDTVAPTESVPISATERWLLWFLLTKEDLLGWIVERLDLRWIRHTLVKSIAETCVSAVESNSWMGTPGLLDRCEEGKVRQLITEIVAEPVQLADAEKTLKGDPGHTDKRGILERLRDDFIDDEMAALRQRASVPEVGDDERINLLRKREELRGLKRQPLTLVRDSNSDA
jgi:hypothetical protein